MNPASPLDNPVAAIGWALLITTLACGIWVGRLARRRGATIAGAVTVSVVLFLGVFGAGVAIGHLVGVIGVAARRATFVYDFRFAALLLVGITVTTAGALCVSAIRGLVRGERASWQRARNGTLLMLLVNAPLVPVQGFSIALVSFAAVCLGLLQLSAASFRAR